MVKTKEGIKEDGEKKNEKKRRDQVKKAVIVTMSLPLFHYDIYQNLRFYFNLFLFFSLLGQAEKNTKQ